MPSFFFLLAARAVASFDGEGRTHRAGASDAAANTPGSTAAPSDSANDGARVLWTLLRSSPLQSATEPSRAASEGFDTTEDDPTPKAGTTATDERLPSSLFPTQRRASRLLAGVCFADDAPAPTEGVYGVGPRRFPSVPRAPEV